MQLRMSAAIVLAGVMCSAAHVASAEVTCTAEYTDCLGTTHSMEWTCANNSQCCTTTYRDVGPDGQRNTSDDCTNEVQGHCEGTSNPCDKIVWQGEDDTTIGGGGGPGS